MATAQDITVSLTADEIKIGELHKNPNPTQQELEDENPIINMTITPAQREGRLDVINAIASDLKEKSVRIFDKSDRALIVRGTKNDLTLALAGLNASGMLKDKGVFDSVASEIDNWKPAKPANYRSSARERHEWDRRTTESPHRG